MLFGRFACKCPIQAYPLNHTLETRRDFCKTAFASLSVLPGPELRPLLPTWSHPSTPPFFFSADKCGCHALVSYFLRRGATRQQWSFVSFRLVSSFRVCLFPLLIFLHLHFLIQTFLFFFTNQTP